VCKTPRVAQRDVLSFELAQGLLLAIFHIYLGALETRLAVDITIVKCVGIGVQDLVAAEVSLKKLDTL
jgi:ornithine cyclodeaminase/alanine dehydrogenase-like protein (mu-crystallin family)